MIFELWAGLIIIAAICTGVVLLQPKSWGMYFICGLIWALVALNCSLIEFQVTYISTGYDYLKDFSYPALGLFFGLFALGNFAVFAYYSLQEVDQVLT